MARAAVCEPAEAWASGEGEFLINQIRNVVSASVPGQPGVSFVTLYSPALRRRADISLFVPSGMQNQSLPLLILMHGVYGSHWNWALLGNVPGIAAEMMRAGTIGAVAIAMPSDGLWGDGSGYVVHRELNAESWIMDDVPACVQAVLPGVQLERLYLAGQSMGGFGALRLGAKYASRVAGISAHSPVTCLADLMQHVEEPLREYQAAGKRDTEILYWMRRNRAQLPAIRIDCGTEDALLGSNRALHKALLKDRTPHSYEEHPGGHDWAYWQEQVRATFQFVSALAYGKAPIH
ncbi:MAG: alpha/beta fold hydrolase [Terracidiphilus sp.]